MDAPAGPDGAAAAARGCVKDEPGSQPVQSEWSILWGNIGTFVTRNSLPLFFLVAITAALAAPAPGRAVMAPQVAGVRVVAFMNVCLVFFVSGLQLRTAELRAVLRARGGSAVAFGLTSIVGVTPLLAWAVRGLPFSPPELATGLAIFAVMPTTLGVGVSLVTSAKGNVAMAILLTVTSNVVGVALIPLWLRAAIGGGHQAGLGASLNIDYLPTFVKLLLSCLAPTVIGKLLRELCGPARRAATDHPRLLSLISNASLAILIWQTISSAQPQIVGLPFGTMLLLLAAALLHHGVCVAFNAAAAAALRLPMPEAACVVIMASQKSAPVAVTVITYIASSAETQGLLAVPCVVGQLVQIFADQPIANYLGARIARWRLSNETLERSASPPPAEEQSPSGGAGSG
ncbi:MAG: putative sodium bile acid cotransporter [Monoraphidium minutum]|nr:MAG: putative sodium bile acid cotransporter [Monoraphidium minutum]